MLNRKNISLFLLHAVYLFLSSSVFGQLPPLTSGWETTKRGGVAFRVGANQPIEDLNAYAALFNTYGYKFAFALGLGNSQFDSQAYIDSIKALQAQGHKLFDLTPNFRINYFYTKFTEYDYSSEPGVDHVDGTKVCLKFESVTIPNANSIRNGTVTVNGNTVTGSGLSSIDISPDIGEYYLYFDSPLDTLVLIESIISDTEIKIKDIWDDAITSLGPSTNVTYYNFDYKGIHMTNDALELLGNESLKLATLYEIDRPYRFILPGTYGTPWGITPTEIKTTFGDELGYISAQTYVNVSVKTYNEYNYALRPFGMAWGNFDEEEWTIEQIKTQIADEIAKHRVTFNHNHFLKNYYSNTSSILQWCSNNNIPVKTADEWAYILYETEPDPTVNIFPPLSVDLDANGIPDGYNWISNLDSSDGPESDNHSLWIENQDGLICEISGLGGLEKGQNNFKFWSKGNGKVIVVFYTLDPDHERFEFSVDDSTEWTEFNLSESTNGNTTLSIPDDLSLMSLSIRADVSSGNVVKIGGMSLNVNDPVPVELTSFTANEFALGVELDWETATEVNNYGFEIERSFYSGSTLIEKSNEWETIGFVEGHGNSYSPKVYSFVDTSNLIGNISYRLKQIDTDGTFEYSKVATIDLSIVSVDVSVILETNLQQNHPNPFNPSTIITYQLANSANVSLKIYDIIGNEVATLIKNEKQNAGNHLVEFNSLDYNNLSSGVYFYQIIAGPYVDTKKMLLLK